MSKFNQFTALILALMFVSQSAIASNTLLDTKLQKDIQMALTQYHLPGISLSYQLGDAKVQTLTAGYSDVVSKQPITPHTYFGVGSITKVFISTMLMQQISLQKFNLDDKLAAIAYKYPGNHHQLSDLVHQFPYLGNITLRQYLTHTSGIVEEMNEPEFLKAFNKNPMLYYSDTQLIAMAMKHPPYFKPGEKDYYGYTNTDYEIAGMVLEAATGKSISNLLKSLNASLNINNIYYPNKHASDIPAYVQVNLAQAYISQNDPSYNLEAFSKSQNVTFSGIKAKEITQIALNSASIGAASGGILAQTSELVKWYWALFHEKIVSRAALNTMTNGVNTANPNKKYALAIVVEKTKKYGLIYSHDGNTFGYRGNLVYVPKLNLVLCIAVNSDTTAFDENTSGITDKLLSEFQNE